MILNLRRASCKALFYPACSWQQFVVQAGSLNQSITSGSMAPRHFDLLP